MQTSLSNDDLHTLLYAGSPINEFRVLVVCKRTFVNVGSTAFTMLTSCLSESVSEGLARTIALRLTESLSIKATNVLNVCFEKND